MGLKLKQLSLGALATNGYMVGNPDTKEAVFIDPAGECDRILRELAKEECKLAGILLTHGHFDHIGAAEELREKTGAKIYAGGAEAALLQNASLNCSHWYGSFTVTPDVLVKDKEVLTLAGIAFQVIATPGHTAGGVCYYVKPEKTLFSGDTLFAGSIGRTDLPTGNMSVLRKSLELLAAMPEDTLVYPGHGPSTTIGDEKRQNPYL